MADDVIGASNVIGFYRSSDPYGFLSNLYPCLIEMDGRQFPSAEHAYQWAKPLEPSVRSWLVSAPKPDIIATTAHALMPWHVRPDWSTYKVERMREVLKFKFEQHPDLMEKLVATGKSELVELSNIDAFWGVGKKGNGKNMLGVLLMELRGEIGR